MKIDSSTHLFKTYQVESFDTKLLVILNLNAYDLYPNDILKVNLTDKIYYTEKDGWYLHLEYNNLVNIRY